MVVVHLNSSNILPSPKHHGLWSKQCTFYGHIVVVEYFKEISLDHDIHVECRYKLDFFGEQKKKILHCNESDLAILSLFVVQQVSVVFITGIHWSLSTGNKSLDGGQ